MPSSAGPAYNTWVAEKCAATGGRLRWNAMVRLTDVESRVAERRRVAELGGLVNVRELLAVAALQRDPPV